MNFRNDSAYMQILDGVRKGKGADASYQLEMTDLMSYIKTAVEYGMYYDVMRFTIKCKLYEDESFDYEAFYAAMNADPELAELLPYAEVYAELMRKKNAKNTGDMADFFLKTQNIFSEDFGRFLYEIMKKCDVSYDKGITEAEVDAVAKSVNKKARPGMLLGLIDYVYGGKTKDVNIFWYAMKKYILPVLGTASYTEKKTNEQAILRNLVSQYAFFIYNVVYLKYILAKDEQSVDDVLDPLVLYWGKDENKASIDEAIRRFYESTKHILPEVLSGRTYEGFVAMMECL